MKKLNFVIFFPVLQIVVHSSGRNNKKQILTHTVVCIFGSNTKVMHGGNRFLGSERATCFYLD